MSDTEEKLQTVDSEALPEQEAQALPSDAAEVPLSPKRRSALVTYLGFLFAIAFLFVAVMFLMETKRLENMNQELNDKNQKTSASLTGLTANINALQEENAKLQKTVEEQEADVLLMRTNADLSEDEIKSLKTQNKELQKQLNEQKKNLETEKSEFEKKLQEQTQRAEDAVKVSELLQSAMKSYEKNDLETLKSLLEQIEPLKELLCKSESEIYEHLKID